MGVQPQRTEKISLARSMSTEGRRKGGKPLRIYRGRGKRRREPPAREKETEDNLLKKSLGLRGGRETHTLLRFKDQPRRINGKKNDKERVDQSDLSPRKDVSGGEETR